MHGIFKNSDLRSDMNDVISGKLLQATDRRKAPFLDILIECDQKTVVSNAAVSIEVYNIAEN